MEIRRRRLQAVVTSLMLQYGLGKRLYLMISSENMKINTANYGNIVEHGMPKKITIIGRVAENHIHINNNNAAAETVMNRHNMNYGIRQVMQNVYCTVKLCEGLNTIWTI